MRTESNNGNEMEFEASTVSEAIIKATKAFHLEKNELEITVLKEEKKGLFGMDGASLAKIRVTKKEKK